MSAAAHQYPKCSNCRKSCVETSGDVCKFCQASDLAFYAKFVYFLPTQAEPGSAEKLIILETRYAEGHPLFQKGDMSQYSEAPTTQRSEYVKTDSVQMSSINRF